MSEEEFESGDGSGLGDLPDDILHDRREMAYDPRPVGKGRPASGRDASAAFHSRRETAKEESDRAGIMDTPEFKADVQSTFDSRPVNTVDTLFSDVIPVVIPVAVSVAPSAPFNEDFGDLDGDILNVTNQQILGLTQWTGSFGADINQTVEIDVDDVVGDNTGLTFAIYVFEDDVAHANESGWSILAAGDTTVITFVATAGRQYDFSILGETPEDISAATVEITLEGFAL